MNDPALQALLEALPMPACLQIGGQIAFVNLRLEQLTGYPAAELVELVDLGQLIAPEHRDRVVARNQARLRGEQVPDDYDFDGLSKSGERFPSRVRVGPFPAAGPDALLMLFSDERARAHTAALIRGFVDAAVAAQRERTQDGLFFVVRDKLLALGLRSAVLEVLGDSFRFAPFASAQTLAGGEVRSLLSGWRPISSLPEQVFSEGTLIDDLPGFLSRLTDASRETYSTLSTRAMVTAVRVEGTTRFILAAAGPFLDSALAGAFGLLGRQLGAALETATRLDELARRNRDLSTINEVARASATLGSGRALEAALEQLTSTLGMERAALFRREEDLLVLAANHGFAEAALSHGPAGAPTPWASAAASGGAVLFEHKGAASAGELDAHCIALPLQAGAEVNGVLVAASAQPLGAAERSLLATVAAQLAVTLQNATLLEQTVRRVEELSLLLDLGREVVGTLELSQVLQSAARLSARALRCSCAAVLLPDESGEALRFAALVDPSPPAGLSVGTLLPLAQRSLSALAFRTRQTVSSANNAADERIDPRLAALIQCRATLAVPLVSQGRSLGVLLLFERSDRLFAPQDVRLASHAAQLLSGALETARLYEDLRRSYAELARTQAELIDRERLAALGELSASIAHEVRNPLGVIFNSVASLRRLLKPAGDVALLLDIVGEEADRLNRMVGDLLDYSRPIQPALQPVPLRPLLEEALAAARQQAGGASDQVRSHVRVTAEASMVRGDARLLRQALVNLFLNALQAMPRGGHLDIKATRAPAPARAAELLIRDSGTGIPADVQPRIFQPFFTTKATGTGLGLAVVKRIVDGHGGEITLRSGAGGAEFRVLLPLDG